MSIIKRLSATLVSSIDRVVGEIENHDAVINASLDGMRKKLAEAKVRLGQVRCEEESLIQKIEEQHSKVQRWHQRAVDCATNSIGGEAKALDCVRRARHCKQQIKKLEHAKEQYRMAADKLMKDIETGEQHFAELRQKHMLMKARQSTASVVNTTNAMGGDAAQFLEDTFSRWEISLSQAESTLDIHDDVDMVEREFLDQEHQHEMRKELEMLLSGEAKDEHFS